MAWTDRQQRCAIAAASKAGWNDMQRYIAMRHAGCAKTQSGQVSLKNPKNPHKAFEQYMAIAESAAALNGQEIYPPKGKASWSAVVEGESSRTLRLIESIWAEGCTKLNRKFVKGGLEGFVERMTSKDLTPCGMPLATNTLGHCDSAQLYRILEGLKAWVAREFVEHGIAPTTFQLTQAQEKRLKQVQARFN